MKPEPRAVLDSWALVAWIRDETAASAVEDFLKQAAARQIELAMSWINVAETFYTLAKRSSPAAAETFRLRLPSLPIQLVLPDQNDIMLAAQIKAAYPVAFGDAFAIALAQSLDAAVVTGDEEIRRCGAVRVSWVGTRR